MVVARAKINLHLHITGRADNGYHHLDSLVAFSDLSDTITIAPHDTYKISVTGDFAKDLNDDDGGNNLITRAAHLLAAQFHIQPHVHIALNKSIPLGAGLGGGSADAAVTLSALRDFWKLPASDDVLYSIAAQMGSDIAACLYGHLRNRPVIMRDTGNTLLPSPELPRLHAVLVNPRTPCPTPLVYKTYAASNEKFSLPVTFPETLTTARALCDFLNTHTRNDLTDAAITTNPDVKIVLNALEALQDRLMVRLSGSGSTCFAIFETENAVKSAADSIQKNNPDWWVRVTSFA